MSTVPLVELLNFMCVFVLTKVIPILCEYVCDDELSGNVTTVCAVGLCIIIALVAVLFQAPVERCDFFCSFIMTIFIVLARTR